MKSAVLYVRVSTDEQAEKGYSQRNQDEVLRKYCELRAITIKAVIYEDHSAKTFLRPAWKSMLAGFKQNKSSRPSLLLFTKWDRFSRNTSDAYQMISLLTKLEIEPQAIEQPMDLSVPENKMMLAFYLAVPEVENDRRALNIFHGIRRARKEGRLMGIAPLGYANKCTENGRKYIKPNFPLANIIQDAFSVIAKGKYPVDQVWKMAVKKGLPCSRNNFRKLIRNPVYAGKIFVPAFKEEPEQLVDGQHEPIISTEVFERVQRILTKKKTSRSAKMVSPLELPLRGFLSCPKCGRTLTGSASKGRNEYYHYYHCSNKCGNRLNASSVNLCFSNLLKRFVAKTPFKELFKEITRDIFKTKTLQKHRQREQVILQIKLQEAQLKKAMDLLFKDAIEIQEYQSLKHEFESRLVELNRQLCTLPDVQESITSVLNKQSRRFLDLQELYKNGSLDDQRLLIATIFKKPLIYDGQDFIYSEPHSVIGLVFKYTEV
ncbi:recombinase family protein [Pedobacter gandavensis]|uniref:recombinase family protein n=1 Tax=Pedobacter gandavensis TaxID=2679963 RepID=UPI00247A837D|nr:recombinase family protein [Pedobacter gandavensis]WGQ09012.1 recombinase family protein [Pedobacter gandavensis]